jgi:hypothetical protein
MATVVPLRPNQCPSCGREAWRLVWYATTVGRHECGYCNAVAPQAIDDALRTELDVRAQGTPDDRGR